MAFPAKNDNTVCRSIEPLLADYQENALSARQVWEVEKHLTSCADCTDLWQQMQATVQVLRSAEHYDTGDDFMARLHARLDEVEPEPARPRSLREVAQDWLVSLRMGARAWQVPALTAGFAAVAAVMVVHGNMPTAPVKAITPAIAERVGNAQVLSRQVAFVASNPFDDPVAAKAEVDGAVGENRADSVGATANF